MQSGPRSSLSILRLSEFVSARTLPLSDRARALLVAIRRCPGIKVSDLMVGRPPSHWYTVDSLIARGLVRLDPATLRLRGVNPKPPRPPRRGPEDLPWVFD